MKFFFTNLPSETIDMWGRLCENEKEKYREKKRERQREREMERSTKIKNEYKNLFRAAIVLMSIALIIYLLKIYKSIEI